MPGSDRASPYLSVMPGSDLASPPFVEHPRS